MLPCTLFIFRAHPADESLCATDARNLFPQQPVEFSGHAVGPLFGSFCRLAGMHLLLHPRRGRRSRTRTGYAIVHNYCGALLLGRPFDKFDLQAVPLKKFRCLQCTAYLRGPAGAVQTFPFQIVQKVAYADGKLLFPAVSAGAT